MEKETWDSNTHITQNKLQNNKYRRDKEGHCIETKGSIQEKNITIVKYICTQYRCKQVYEANTNGHKGRNIR